MALWYAVYDGPVYWEGRSAFEQIWHLEDQLTQMRQSEGHRADIPDTSISKATCP
jgi:hypothetical protein